MNYKTATKVILFILFIINNQAKSQDISEIFKKKWEIEIGQTTFRSNIIFDSKNQIVIVGSCGESSRKLNDKKDGVYLIDPISGKISKHINVLQAADGDVCGVAISNDLIYFGDDNERVYCYDYNGNQKWNNPLGTLEGGDIEGCPVLVDLNNDKIKDVVILNENVGLTALDGKTGSFLWQLTDTILGYGLNSPAAIDLNNDKIDDIIIGSRTDEIYYEDGSYWGSYGDWIFAINGKDGSTLWKYPVFSALNASPIIVKKGKEIEIIHAPTYSQVFVLDAKGALIKYSNQSVPNGGISGFFSSPVLTPENHIIIGTAWWDDDDGVWTIDMNDTAISNGDAYIKNSGKKFHNIGRTSASAVVADIDEKTKGFESMICSESGKLLILNEKGEQLYLLNLPSKAEATPFIGDIDKDGKLEILIACLDGKLYCYDTESKGKVFIGQFRVDNQNTGVVEMK